MIVFLLIALLLFGTAVALIARALISPRLRTVDTLGQIGRYGFTGTFDLEPPGGLRGAFDGVAGSLGRLLTERLQVMNEDRLRKQLAMAGMYQTEPREVIGYGAIGAFGAPALWIWLAVVLGANTALTIFGAIAAGHVGLVRTGLRRAAAR